MAQAAHQRHVGGGGEVRHAGHGAAVARERPSGRGRQDHLGRAQGRRPGRLIPWRRTHGWLVAGRRSRLAAVLCPTCDGRAIRLTRSSRCSPCAAFTRSGLPLLPRACSTTAASPTRTPRRWSSDGRRLAAAGAAGQPGGCRRRAGRAVRRAAPRGGDRRPRPGGARWPAPRCRSGSRRRRPGSTRRSCCATWRCSPRWRACRCRGRRWRCWRAPPPLRAGRTSSPSRSPSVPVVAAVLTRGHERRGWMRPRRGGRRRAGRPGRPRSSPCTPRRRRRTAT